RGFARAPLAPPAERGSALLGRRPDGGEHRDRRAPSAGRPGGAAHGGPAAGRPRARDAQQHVRLRRRAMTDAPDKLESIVGEMLRELGEDAARDGLARTPLRVAKALRFLTEGYQQDPVSILNGALFEVSYDEMVLVKDV